MCKMRKCKCQNFSSQVEFVEIVDTGLDEIIANFQELCNDCGGYVQSEQRTYKFFDVKILKT